MRFITNSTTIRNAIENVTLEMLDLNEFYPLIDTSNFYRIGCLDCAAYEREKFTCKYLTSSPMYVVPLDLFCNLIFLKHINLT